MKDLKNNIDLFLEFFKNILISFLSTLDFIIGLHISKFTLSRRNNLNFIRREFSLYLTDF